MIFHKLTINRVILLIYIFTIVYFVTAILTDDSVKLWGSVVVGTATYSYLIYALWSKNRLVPHKGDCRIELSREVVYCKYDNGRTYQIKLEDIRKISATKTYNKKDPSTTELWLRFHSYPWRRVMSIPWRANDFHLLYDKVTGFDRFDISKIELLKSSEKLKHIVLWEKED